MCEKLVINLNYWAIFAITRTQIAMKENLCVQIVFFDKILYHLNCGFVIATEARTAQTN